MSTSFHGASQDVSVHRVSCWDLWVLHHASPSPWPQGPHPPSSHQSLCQRKCRFSALLEMFLWVAPSSGSWRKAPGHSDLKEAGSWLQPHCLTDTQIRPWTFLGQIKVHFLTPYMWQWRQSWPKGSVKVAAGCQRASRVFTQALSLKHQFLTMLLFRERQMILRKMNRRHGVCNHISERSECINIHDLVNLAPAKRR